MGAWGGFFKPRLVPRRKSRGERSQMPVHSAALLAMLEKKPNTPSFTL